MFKKNKIVIGFCLFSLYFIGNAQDSLNYEATNTIEHPTIIQHPEKPNTFDKKEWETLKNNLQIEDYTPIKKEEKKEIKKESKYSNWINEIPKEYKKLIQWILFGILFLLLIYFIYKTIGFNPFKKNKNADKINVALDELEDNLDKANIDPHLHEAIKSKQYKLAIRLYYLMIIQKLAYKEKIIWKKYKTNQHYLKEMRQDATFPTLKQLTFLYEQCWFGKENISEKQYDNINPIFVNYLQNIK